MIPIFQRLLLGAYDLTRRAGILSTGPGRRAFVAAYDFYKAHWEADIVDALQPLAKPGSLVIDVGANIGFFTRRLAAWVGPAGKVLAIEPEAVNFESLSRFVAPAGNVRALQAVAADSCGIRHLVVTPDHPGDHHLGDAGVPVQAYTIDALVEGESQVEGEPRRPVSLIKIDVQGAELSVVAGAAATLRTHRPALVIEVDPVSLRRVGHSAAEVFATLAGLGYTAHQLRRDGWSPAMDQATALAALDRAGTYVDFVFLPVPAGAQ